MTASHERGGTSIAVGAAQAPLPGVWRVGWSRGQVELKAFFRERQSVVFIFAMPAVMLVLLGAIFGGQHTAPGRHRRRAVRGGADRRRRDGHQLPVPGHLDRDRARAVHAEAAARHADARRGLLHRQGHPGPRRRAGRGGGADGGRRGVLPPAAARVPGGLVDVRLGVRARGGRLLAAGHRGQQPAALGGAQRGP